MTKPTITQEDWVERDIELLSLIHDVCDAGDINQDAAVICMEAVREHRAAAVAELQAEIERLRRVVLNYADDLCEHSTCNEGCGKFDELTCGGCFARAALNPQPTGKEGGK